MSRLDSFIGRVAAQRDCLNFIKPEVDALAGPIVEAGLGNGRTYDHLRELFPARDIYVFERQVMAHPECIPPADRLVLGEIRETIPAMARRMGPVAALIHADMGSGDRAANDAMGRWLGPVLDQLVAPGGHVLCSQPLDVARWRRLPEPPGVAADRYYLYRAP